MVPRKTYGPGHISGEKKDMGIVRTNTEEDIGNKIVFCLYSRVAQPGFFVCKATWGPHQIRSAHSHSLSSQV